MSLVSEGSVSCSCLKTVDTALGLSLFHFDSTIAEAMEESGLKHSAMKCFSHNTLCLDGPLHRLHVHLTSFVPFSLRTGSVVNFKKLTPCVVVFEHAATMQYFTIFSETVTRAGELH